jgi:AcrR family transcriptional regulator
MLGEPTADWQTRRRSAARRAILDAAWQVAREQGLAALTLRAVAARVGMRAPSLYSHFDSKHAIYDAMFAEAWTEYEAVIAAVEPPAAPRVLVRVLYGVFFDFSTADLPRHQIMNIRTIPDFAPSAQAYAPAVRVYGRLRELLAAVGVHEQADLDLVTAVIGGLVDQQWANDPGGDRWARLVDRAADMVATALGLAGEEEP